MSPVYLRTTSQPFSMTLQHSQRNNEIQTVEDVLDVLSTDDFVLS